MDTACYCCQWLLWTTVMLLLHHYQEVSVSAHLCPQGQLLHPQRRRPSATCCYPTRCGVGEEVRPCAVNATQDTCQKCERHQNQSLRTSSFTMDRCVDWPLNSECKSVHNPDRPRDILDERTKRCMCNIEQGKKFYPPESQSPGAPMDSYCQRRNDTCQPGSEPRVDGGCQPCQKNYFKAVMGYSLCEPKRDCTLLGLKYTFIDSNGTADNNCSQSDPMITKPSLPQGPPTTSTTPKTTAEVLRQSSTTDSTPSWHDGSVHLGTSLGPAVRHAEDKILWPIVGTLLALVALLVCGGLMFYCRHRRFMVCVYAAAKDCTDAEDNNVQGTTYEPIACRGKHSTANGSASSQNLVRGGKNNSNGTAHAGIEDLPNGHVHTSIPHGHVECVPNDGVQYPNALQYVSVAAQRPGILRTGNRHVMFDDRQTNWPDLTLDLMGQTHRAHGGFEANPELGESDCLLISEHQQAAGAHQMDDSCGSSSPALLHDGSSSVQVLALTSGRDTNFPHRMGKNGQFLPPLRLQGQAAPVEGATFTRSVSLIASPEGEVDEEEMVALFPRFSQLLQEDDDSESKEPPSSSCKTSTLVLTPACHQQATTQRPPDPPPHQTPHPHPRPPPPVPRTASHTAQPDHCIMNLKEQDLVGSMPSHTTAAHLTSSPTPVVPEEAQQTQLKTLGSTRVFSNSSDSTNVNSSKAKHLSESSDSKQSNTDGISHNLAERSKHKTGAVNDQFTHKEKCNDFQGSSDRKTVPFRDSNGQTLPEQTQARPGDQTLGLKPSSSEETETSTKDKQRLNNRVVFFGDGDNLQTSNKQPRLDTWRPERSQGLSETTGSSSRTLRSGSEKANTAQTSSDAEEGERNPQPQRTNISATSSKVSLNGDLAEDSNGNNGVYRRSQSHNAPSSSESAHKPPPRSMSEEKPQKLDRPVAKVKPMPASDSSVNQLPLGVPGDDGLVPQPLICALPAASNNTILSSSTEESDQEQDTETNCESHTTVDDETDSGPD